MESEMQVIAQQIYESWSFSGPYVTCSLAFALIYFNVDSEICTKWTMHISK